MIIYRVKLNCDIGIIPSIVNYVGIYIKYEKIMEEKNMKMTLGEFVVLCNNCSEDITESKSGWDSLAKQLGKSMVQGILTDLDDESFYKSLLGRGYTEHSTEYIFLQDETIKAKINPFKPYGDMSETKPNNRILSQKWHVLIAVLAYFDTASFYPDAANMNKYDIGKITSIELDILKRKITIHGEKENKPYGTRQSKLMNEWIFDCLCKDLGSLSE